MKQKTFFIIFKGLSLKYIKGIFLEDESPTLRWKLFSGYSIFYLKITLIKQIT